MKIDLTTDKDYFRPDIQGLRGVAVLLVVIYHTGLALPGGFIGVDMFFVISGFVITQLLLRESDQNGKISLKNFYYRRARRLIPALSIVIIFTLVSSVFVMSPFGEQQQIVKTAIASTFFAGNIHLFAMNTYDALKDNPLRHLWSLGVEEQFYLIYPLVFLSICKFSTVRNFRKRLLGTLIFFMTSSFLFSALLSSGFEFGYKNGSIIHQNLSFLTNIGFVAGGDWPTKFAFFGAPSRFWEILLGALIAIVFSFKYLFPDWLARVVTLIGALALIATALFLTTEANFPGLLAVIPVFATGILIVFGEEKTLVNKILSAPPLVLLGDISYSLYLWHWPMIVFSRAIWPGTAIAPLVAAALSFGIANLSFQKVEARFRHQDGSRKNLTWQILVALVCTVLFAGVSKSFADTGLNIPVPESKFDNYATKNACADGSDMDQTECFFASDGRFLAILIGDSNARSASDGVASAVHSLGGDLIISYKSGCPLVDNDPIPDCQELNKVRFESLTRLKPALVIIVSNQLAYISNLGETGVIAGFTRTLEFLNKSEIPAVVQGNIPDCVSTRSLVKVWSKKIFECEIGLSRQTEWSTILETSRLLTLNYPDNEFIDPTPTICPNRDCRAKVDGDWVFSDMNHLSPTGSRMLTPEYIKAIKKILLNR